MEEMIRNFISVSYGYGYGYGSGYGYGYGSGSGYGTLIGCVLNSHMIYDIDDVATIIYRVFGNYAKGAIVNDDMTLTPCYVAKHGSTFAHGETLREARQALEKKLLEDMPIEERIEAFREKFKPGKAYPTLEFYEWHNMLTGSCEMGRKQFAKEHGVNLDGEMTVEQFINLTENAYGGENIKMLKPYYLTKKEGDNAH